MGKINDLPYAKWLEESLQNVIGSNTQAICIMTRNESGEVGSGYYNCSVPDKLMFAGFIQQDALLDTMTANGIIVDDEENEEDEFEDG